jgi:hypothetical protein
MTIINDYTFRILAEQRQHELWAEAAGDRLAASVRGDRPMWWRRLIPTRFVPATKRPAPSSAVPAATLPGPSGVPVPGQPVPC